MGRSSTGLGLSGVSAQPREAHFAHPPPSLTNGEEYVDLTQIDRGVCTSRGTTASPMGVVLPERAVHPATWVKVVAGLSYAMPPAR